MAGRGAAVGDLRAIVNPPLGRTHAFDGWARMITLGLRVARTAQRNATGKTFCALAVLPRAESQWFADPRQTPLDVYVSPCFSRRGDHPPSLRSGGNGDDVHKPVVTAVIKDSAITSADPL